MVATSAVENAVPGNLVELPLGRVFPNPDQPRKVFDEEELLKLARSIEAVGRVLQPIMVRPRGDGFQIVLGERRWRASALAGRPTIMATIEDVDDETMALLSLAENLVRANLNFVEEARFYKELLRRGYSWERISAMVGVGRDGDQPGKYLAWKVEIIDRCIPVALLLLEKGQLGADQAWALTKVSANGQMLFLRKLQQQPMTLQEQLGLIEQIWASENQAEAFAECKLTDEQRAASRAFRSMLDKAIRAAEDTERLQELLGPAMATELDLTLLKLKTLLGRLSRIHRSLLRAHGRIRAGGDGRPVKLPRVSDVEAAERAREMARAKVP